MLLILCLLGAAGVAAAQADLLLKNGRIHTPGGIVSELAIRDGRIVRAAGGAKEEIDLRGAHVFPGLIDSHGHVAGLGESLEILDLRDAGSAAEVASRVAAAAKGKPKGEWVMGRSWDQTRWPVGEFPDSRPLDAAAPDNPVYLTRVDGHAAWVNQRALDMADVNAATKDPAGGRILRDSAGKPTGVLVDRAMPLVRGKIPPPSLEQVKRRIELATQKCASLGLTSVHDAGVGAREIDAYRQLIADGRLPIRVYAMIGGAGDLWRRYLETGPDVGPYLTVRSIKLVADGALGSRGAAMKQDYSDEPGKQGLMITGRAAIEQVARDAVRRGFQVNTHAIGDRANREVLDAYAAALGGRNDRRFRVEHAQIVDPGDLDLFAHYSIIASMQATHATSDMRWAEKRIGKARLAGAYAWQQLLKRGVRIANGSDFPVEDANPMPGIYASITRQDGAGWPDGGWLPGERMSRAEALESWTAAGAYAAFEEKDKGTLEPGKMADLIVLPVDLMEAAPAEILNARVRMTMVGGKVVYRERGW